MIELLIIVTRLNTRNALPGTLDMAKDWNVALCRTVGRDVGSSILLYSLNEVCVLANCFDAETTAKVGELLAFEAVKRIGGE